MFNMPNDYYTTAGLCIAPKLLLTSSKIKEQNLGRTTECANIRNIQEVVYVMGNSVGIAKRHYVREVTKEWMDKFWALKPSE